MTVFQRWISRSLIVMTLNIALILTFLVWMVQSLKYIAFFSHQSLSSFQMIQLCLGGVPRIFCTISPLAFAGACCWVYTMLVRSRQYDAMSSAGASPLFFMVSSLLTALLWTGALYGITLYISPKTWMASKQQEHALKYILDPSLVVPGVFFNLSHRTIYVHKQINNYTLQGVFIYDNSHPLKESILTGKQAKIIPTASGFRLILENGTHQQIFKDDKPPTLLHFDSYAVQFNPPQIKARVKHAHELSVKELNTALYGKGGSISSGHHPDLRKEWCQRFIFPLSLVFYGLWVPWWMLTCRASFGGWIISLGGICLGHLCFSFLLPWPLALGLLCLLIASGRIFLLSRWRLLF